MRRYLYLSTAVAGVMMTAGAGASFAQCVTTQNCAELGYTETSCPDGTGIKCPFGDTFACTGGSCANDCAELGFTYSCTGTGEQGVGKPCNGKYQGCSCDSSYQYTCSGTGYSGGSGTACGGKYTACTCKAPYTWSNGTCTCPSTYKYACTGTGYSGGSGTACGGKYRACQCMSGYTWQNGACVTRGPCDGKSHIANGNYYCCNNDVAGVKTSGMNFYVAMRDLGTLEWSDADAQCRNYSFCGSDRGTLPTMEQLQSIYNNKSQVNSLLSANGGTKMTEGWYWSSTSTTYHHYILHMSNGDEDKGNHYYNPYNFVRPILTSW